MSQKVSLLLIITINSSVGEANCDKAHRGGKSHTPDCAMKTTPLHPQPYVPVQCTYSPETWTQEHARVDEAAQLTCQTQ